MFANEQDYEKFLLDGEDPFEFQSIWIGYSHKTFDADKIDLLIAAGAFKEEDDAEER